MFKEKFIQIRIVSRSLIAKRWLTSFHTVHINYPKQIVHSITDKSTQMTLKPQLRRTYTHLRHVLNKISIILHSRCLHATKVETLQVQWNLFDRESFINLCDSFLMRFLTASFICIVNCGQTFEYGCNFSFLHEKKWQIQSNMTCMRKIQFGTKRRKIFPNQMTHFSKNKRHSLSMQTH